MFIFDGGVLEAGQITHLHIVDSELQDFRFAAPAEMAGFLRPYVWRRVQAALDTLRGSFTTYCENGYSGTSLRTRHE
jgi:hypothetical protein